MRRRAEELLSFLEAFPSAVATFIGNGWTAQDVVAATEELKKRLGLPASTLPTRVPGVILDDFPESGDGVYYE